MTTRIDIFGNVFTSALTLQSNKFSLVGSDQEILTTFPVDEKPFDPAGEIIRFDRDGTSTFIPLNSLTPGTSTCYGTFSGNPINNIPAMNIPAINIPAMNIPAINIPAINIPAINIPAINIPAINIISIAILSIYSAFYYKIFINL